jgi:hypothetical protein
MQFFYFLKTEMLAAPVKKIKKRKFSLIMVYYDLSNKIVS